MNDRRWGGARGRRRGEARRRVAGHVFCLALLVTSVRPRLFVALCAFCNHQSISQYCMIRFVQYANDAMVVRHSCNRRNGHHRRPPVVIPSTTRPKPAHTALLTAQALSPVQTASPAFDGGIHVSSVGIHSVSLSALAPAPPPAALLTFRWSATLGGRPPPPPRSSPGCGGWLRHPLPTDHP